MAYNNGIISAPVGIYDVQRALGTNECDLGSLCKHANINPMAKFKPIRNSKIGMLSPSINGAPSDRYSARFGFDSITPKIQFDGNNLDPHGKWVYLKPRGGASEPYRLTDFINEGNPTREGYYANALPPFAFKAEGLELTANTTVDGDGGVGISLYVNSGVNAFYPNGGWDGDTCMTISEMLNNYSGGAYIGFAIRDITSPTGGFVAIVSRYKLAGVGSSVPTLILHSKNYVGGGMLSPEVALLHQGERAGHTFRFIAFLWSTFPSFSATIDGTTRTYNENSAEYSILSTTPNFSADSLEFFDNIDRQDIVATLVEGSIAGLTGSIHSSNLTLTLTSNSTVTYNGRQYYRYQIGGTVYGNFKTPSGHWNPDGQVRVYLRLSGDGIPSYVNPETGNSEYAVNVNLSNGNTQYNNVALVNFSSLSDPAYMYVEPDVAYNEAPYITMTGKAKPSYYQFETIYLDGEVTASAQKIPRP